MSDTAYVACCIHCSTIFTPPPGSSLWWQAKQRAEKGFLNAIPVSGEECGCIKKPLRPDAPFRVFGYDDICTDFDIPRDTFVQVVKIFMDLNKSGANIVYISGVSRAVEEKLTYMQLT